MDRRSPRQAVGSDRPELPTHLLLNGYAAISAVILLRTLLVILEVTDRVWIGTFVYGVLRPVTNVLDTVPGASREIFFHLSVADLTLLTPVVLFPLGLIATSGRYR